MAIIHCADIKKASFLKMLGIIDLALVGIDLVVEINLVGVSAVAMLPLSLAFTILYIVGASKNENAYDAGR